MPVREKDLTRLEKWGVDEVLSEGQFIETQNEDLMNSKLLWGIPSDKELSAIYNETLSKLDTLFARIDKMEDIDIKEIDQISDKLVDTVEDKYIQSVRMVLTHNSANKAIAKECFEYSYSGAYYRLCHGEAETEASAALQRSYTS